MEDGAQIQSQPAITQSPTATDQETDLGPLEDIRVVLIGKTGNGKSSSGNTILNQVAFKTALSPNSVTSECRKARGVVDTSRVAVIDTPGIYDTKYKEEEVLRKLIQCISLSAPGPHAFLIVIRLGRFTQEEQNTVELLGQVFGEEAAKYSMVLFTHGEQLRGNTIEDYFSRCGRLSYLIEKCNWRYHVFSNTNPMSGQVPQLLSKIKSMISDNGGTFYTNSMYQEAEKAIQEEALKILKARAEKKQRQEEQLRARLRGEVLQENMKLLEEEHKRVSREKAEKKNKFIKEGLVVTFAQVGVTIGAGVAVAAAPLFMAIGAGVGGLIGAAVGVLGPAKDMYVL
ncbi:hypothetical protein CRENBAI_010788 [Crenichthys baileyi]|uniref:AIG1-type G domain-containing protein n=1 Tax=Crenichthys baileyi TaxID=28760 RepID=A0AAV9RK28_9TELE